MNYRVGEWTNPDNVFAQPKNYALIQRNEALRPRMPWELYFNFKFDPAGAGKNFDNRGLFLADSTNISLQTALATGIAYYHRRTHWPEAPAPTMVADYASYPAIAPTVGNNAAARYSDFDGRSSTPGGNMVKAVFTQLDSLQAGCYQDGRIFYDLPHGGGPGLLMARGGGGP